jgi:hypothetical protein
MRIHLLFCDYCVRFEEQSRWMKIIARRNLDDLEKGIEGECLSAEARDRIRQALHKDS